MGFEQYFLPWLQLNVNMKIIFMTLVTTTLSESILGENFDPHCEGSLNIFDTSGKRHSFAFSQDGLNKLKTLNATVHCSSPTGLSFCVLQSFISVKHFRAICLNF